MKRNYIAPEMEIQEIELETIVAGSPSVMGISSEKGGESEDFAQGHRGTWGNLWE